MMMFSAGEIFTQLCFELKWKLKKKAWTWILGHENPACCHAATFGSGLLGVSFWFCKNYSFVVWASQTIWNQKGENMNWVSEEITLLKTNFHNWTHWASLAGSLLWWELCRFTSQLAGVSAVNQAGPGARSEGLSRPSHTQHVPNNRSTNQNHLLPILLKLSLDALPVVFLSLRLIQTQATKSGTAPGFPSYIWQKKEKYFPWNVFQAASFIINPLPLTTSTTSCNVQNYVFAVLECV